MRFKQREEFIIDPEGNRHRRVYTIPIPENESDREELMRQAAEDDAAGIRTPDAFSDDPDAWFDEKGELWQAGEKK